MERSQNAGEVRRMAVQFVKFAIVGALNTIVDFLVFQALNLLVGLMAQPIVTAITNGLMMFE